MNGRDRQLEIYKVPSSELALSRVLMSHISQDKIR